MADNGQDIELENVNPAVIPSESEQDFLRRVWVEALAEMLGETKSRWEDAFRTARAEAAAAVAELRASVGEARVSMERMIEDRLGGLRKLVDEKNGPRIRPYEEGRVHYEGELVTHQGSTYQALRDTGRAPPDQDHWICVAAGGLDGQSPRVRGTYTPVERYTRLDIVALNGSAFIARRDDPGDCPGEDWQLMSAPGKRGQQGPRGERGERGPSGTIINSWRIDRERYRATPLLSDGTEGPALELRPLFEQYHMESSGE
jgi:hypothetical protein